MTGYLRYFFVRIIISIHIRYNFGIITIYVYEETVHFNNYSLKFLYRIRKVVVEISVYNIQTMNGIEFIKIQKQITEYRHK